MSDDDDDGGDDKDDNDDDNGDDNGDWYFGLKGRRSRSPGQRPGYWCIHLLNRSKRGKSFCRASLLRIAFT